MGIMVYSLLWVMQDLYHQPYIGTRTNGALALGFSGQLDPGRDPCIPPLRNLSCPVPWPNSFNISFSGGFNVPTKFIKFTYWAPKELGPNKAS